MTQCEHLMQLRSSRCTWQGGQLSFFHAGNGLGWKDLCFRLTADGEQFDSRQAEWKRIPSEDGTLVMMCRPPSLPLEITITITATAEEDRLLLRCRYRNRSGRTVRIADVVEGEGAVVCPQGRAFHIENIKQMFISALNGSAPPDRRLAWGTVLCGRSYWADLGRELVYGRSEDQPYPALFLASPGKGGLVDAQFSQDRWYREVRIGQADGRGAFAYSGAMTTRGVRWVKVPPGRSVDGEITWLQITPRAELEPAFECYNEALLEKYDFRPVASPNREELIWGSWNLGIWDKCTDDLIVGNARIIKEHFPRVRWVQIDEGWSKHRLGAMGCPLYEGHNPEKFPRGMKAVAGDIKNLGLRPALWCGMHISEGAQVVREHPEWLLQNVDGTPHTAGGYILDYSREDVRDFLVRTYRRIIREWGYEGIKLDFWTYGFEDHGIAYQNDDRTSLELRNWWLKTLRDLLPEDGYLQTGCNVCSVSPFVSRWVDNIRYGVDVGEGDNWNAVTDTASWLAALSLCAPGRMWLPNSDAIGSMKRMDPPMRRTWLSFCSVTGSALELGSDLRQESPDDWRDAQRILDGLRVGQTFRALDFGQPDAPVPPTLWFSPGGVADARDRSYAGMLCAFNWDGNGPSRRRVAFAELGLREGRYRVVNYWTGEEAVCEGGIELPAIDPRDVHALLLHSLSGDDDTTS